jgi:hypothetical protein
MESILLNDAYSQRSTKISPAFSWPILRESSRCYALTWKPNLVGLDPDFKDHVI